MHKLLMARSRKNHTITVAPLQLISVTSLTDHTSGASIDVTVPSVKAGDKIIVLFQYAGTQPTWIMNASDGINTYNADYDVYGGGGAVDIHSRSATAIADATNLVVSASFSGHSILGVSTVYVLRGSNITSSWIGQSYTNLQPAGPITSGPYDVQNGSFVIMTASMYISSGNPVAQVTAPQPVTLDTDGVVWSTSSDYESWHYMADAATNQTVSFSSSTSSQWRLTYVIGVISG